MIERQPRHELPPTRLLLALTATAVGLMAVAILLDPVMPVIKKLWTPSFALLSGGFSLLIFLALLTLVGPDRTPRWTAPLRVFGANATLAFIAISLLDTLMQLPLPGTGATANLHDTVARQLGAFIADPQVASVTYSALLLMLVGLLLWPLYRKRIFFKL